MKQTEKMVQNIIGGDNDKIEKTLKKQFYIEEDKDDMCDY